MTWGFLLTVVMGAQSSAVSSKGAYIGQEHAQKFHAHVYSER